MVLIQDKTLLKNGSSCGLPRLLFCILLQRSLPKLSQVSTLPFSCPSPGNEIVASFLNHTLPPPGNQPPFASLHDVIAHITTPRHPPIHGNKSKREALKNKNVDRSRLSRNCCAVVVPCNHFLCLSTMRTCS